MKLEEIREELEKQLDKKRYDHTMGVMYTSAALAMQHGLDINSAMLAGLLHDCGKQYKASKQYQLCNEYKINLTDTEKLNHSLIHAKLGSYLAEHIYQVTDDAILSAITYHTTGRPNMSILEKIVYIADYIEPYRNLPYVEEFRAMAFKDLDYTMYRMLDMSLEHLTSTQKVIDEMTVETHLYYKNLININEINN